MDDDFDKQTELTMARVRQVIHDRAERARESINPYLKSEQTTILEGAFRSFLVDFLHLVEKTTGEPMQTDKLKALVDDAFSVYTMEKQGPFRVIVRELNPHE